MPFSRSVRYPPQSPINAQIGTAYTLAITDLYRLVTLNNGAAITLTIPTDANVPLPVNGFIDCIQIGAGQVTVAPAGGVTLNGTPGLLFTDQYSAVSLLKVAANSWIAIGRLST